ncbi:nucleoside 2-deoxyribosyltransferase [Pseudomonas syringae group sp. J309-1]|uniref:nucleoside 2-deoxyribosyltransferase n=1 Tax=Pseudomonas syringae group sp. J309-1 TaxID=3079588 RepID=UPI002907C724|nr:nucleoside 2-deoxyribosyltransferase [Pseudomonas syringae group sp. J309-1]MDU8359965.1 nucleoside 2-deoxyribosyltransferase [Pseudomonas syringae group sp. J309-1]
MNKRTAVYLAAPLFNEMELSFNRTLKELLTPYFDVFLPQEDGLLLREIVASGTSKDVAERMVFDADVQAMRDSDLIIAVLHGAHIDEGVAFELGYCFAMGKRCIGLKGDVRQALPTGNNPMINQSCERIFNNRPALLAWISSNFTEKAI